MNKIYLDRNAIESILQFLDTVNPQNQTVEITSDSSSGIGSVITAKIRWVDFKGIKVNVEREISGEDNW